MNSSTDIKEILILDDEPSVLFALKLLVQAIGFIVHDFSVPEEAVAYVEAGKPCDLMLSDLRMPRLNGHDVLALVKKSNPKLPVVMMSAHAVEEDQVKAKALGSIAFLSKPFSPDQLKNIVSDIEQKKAS